MGVAWLNVPLDDRQKRGVTQHARDAITHSIVLAMLGDHGLGIQPSAVTASERSSISFCQKAVMVQKSKRNEKMK